MKRIDLNCDLGEGGAHDAELMGLITSANIACGGHAGTVASMRGCVALAHWHGVAVGAHPGFADREHFGRREISLPPDEITQLVHRQILALSVFGPVHHVKPHGVLYNVAARDAGVAEAVLRGVREVDASLVLVALAGSELARAARAQGFAVAEEVFADRTYQPDGSLTPRSKPDALIESADAMLEQVLRLVQEGTVRAVDGSDVAVTADTVCLHGDGPHAVEFARRLRAELRKAGVEVASVNAHRLQAS